MSESWFDLEAILIIGGVVALFGWYFWHTAQSIVTARNAIVQIADSRAAKQRRELAEEAVHGPKPLFIRVGRVLSITALIGMLAFMLLRKFGLV